MFLLSVYVSDSLHPVRWEQLQRRFQNIALARIFGPMYYHAYDSYEYLRTTWHLEGRRAFGHQSRGSAGSDRAEPRGHSRAQAGRRDETPPPSSSVERRQGLRLAGLMIRASALI